MYVGDTRALCNGAAPNQRREPARAQILLDSEGRIRTWCRAAELTGFDEDEMKGLHFTKDFLTWDVRHLAEEQISLATRKGRAVTFRLQVFTKAAIGRDVLLKADASSCGGVLLDAIWEPQDLQGQQ